LNEYEQVLKDRLAVAQPNLSKDGHSIRRGIELITLRKYLDDERIVKALTEILVELERAEKKHPVWPTDMVHQASVMNGEAGECLKAANHLREGRNTEGKDSLYMVLCEAIQTGAMAMRLLIHHPQLMEQD